MKQIWLGIILVFLVGSNVFAAQVVQSVSGNEVIVVETEKPILSVIISSNGTVLYKKANTSYWDEVTKNQEFYTLDEVKTATASFCEIKLSGGHIIKLEENTELTFQGKNKKNSVFQKLKTTVGKLWIKVVKGSSADDQFQVETPYASISVKGTLFSVDSLLKKVATFEGKVEVMNQQGTTLLEKGFETNVGETGIIDPAKKLTDQSLNEFKNFAKDSSLPKDYLDDVYKNISEPVAPAPKPVEAPAASLPALPVVVPIIPVIMPPMSFMPDLGGLFGPRPTVNSINVRGKIFETDSVLYSNPAYLTLIASGDVGAWYVRADDSGEVKKYTDKTKASNYRFPLAGGLESINGKGGSVTEKSFTVAFDGFDKGQAIGLYYSKSRSAAFQTTSVNVNQMDLITLYYGLAAELARFNVGAVIKGTLILDGRDQIAYSKLNLDRDNAINKDGFSELFSNISKPAQTTVYSLTAGSSYDISEWCSLGFSLENFFLSDKEIVKGSKVDLDSKGHISTLFHNEDVLGYVDLASSDNRDNLLSFGLGYRLNDGLVLGYNGKHIRHSIVDELYADSNFIGLYTRLTYDFSAIGVIVQYNF